LRAEITILYIFCSDNYTKRLIIYNFVIPARKSQIINNYIFLGKYYLLFSLL